MKRSRPLLGIATGVLAVAAVLLIRPSTLEAQVAFGGMVQVLNRGPEPLTVIVDGRTLAVAMPGATVQVANVAAGYHAIYLRNPEGRFRGTGRFFLANGGSYTHTFPPVGGFYHRPRPFQTGPVLGYGRVQVMNRFLVPAHVYLNGKFYGAVGASRDLILNQVPIGVQMLEARNAFPPQETFRQQKVIVQRNVLSYAMLMPSGGVLRVVNSHPMPVEVLVDGRPMQIIPPGQTVHIPNIPQGRRSLEARLNGQVVENLQAPIYQGQTYTWYVKVTSGAVRIVNRLPEPLNVTMDGTPRGTVMPGQEIFVGGVPSGSHNLVAMAPTGQVRKSETLTVGSGETRSWFLQAASGHEPHAHAHAHPHQPGGHHHHPHEHPHPGGLDHHHMY